MTDMTKDKATKRPWKYLRSELDFKYMITGKKINEDNYVVTTEGSVKEDEANVKLIVKAVNCHDELVEALKYVINSAINSGISGINGEELQIIRRKCEQAIQKANACGGNL